MKVRIVRCEDENVWILGKFARKLRDELLNLGVEADIDKVPDPSADINHHIIYLDYNLSMLNKCDTLMITHVDELNKVGLLKSFLGPAKLGICMSSNTMLALASSGIPREKLCFVNPAHDDVIKPRPKIIGICTKIQSDGRKREYLIKELIKYISPIDFQFVVMGDGLWPEYISAMKNKGFKVKYYDQFDYDIYVEILPTFDYYLYMGMDEGQMGFVDAAAAGVETIVTNQGYHLDAVNGIYHGFTNLDELVNIFRLIAERRRSGIDSVKHWTWKHYAQKHLEIWEYLVCKETKIEYILPKDLYNDGIVTLKEFSRNDMDLQYNVSGFKSSLIRRYFTQRYYKYRALFYNGGLIRYLISNKLRIR